MLRTRLSRRLAGGFLAVAVGLAAGCGGGDASVQGAVSYDGTPVDAGAVTFLPDGGEGKKVGARIYDGRYQVENGLGLVPGRYKVAINWDKKTGKRTPTGEGTSRDETKEGLSAKYHTATTLTAEVKGGANTIDFNLSK